MSRKSYDRARRAIRELTKRCGTYRRIVRQAVTSALRPEAGHHLNGALRRSSPKRGVIDGWIEADDEAPRRQWHTARRRPIGGRLPSCSCINAKRSPSTATSVLLRYFRALPELMKHDSRLSEVTKLSEAGTVQRMSCLSPSDCSTASIYRTPGRRAPMRSAAAEREVRHFRQRHFVPIPRAARSPS